ncbi:hypothetical protein AWB78_05925 [Caballeronia calidae]|uniref:Uncharacterized protein n=1 Tax=Caballeronia calidae TaxID=1777139 RepID=A0A158E1I5_9BURK|nr:hypothetical protein AWB78_05925 [Caballeronia calidae]
MRLFPNSRGRMSARGERSRKRRRWGVTKLGQRESQSGGEGGPEPARTQRPSDPPSSAQDLFAGISFALFHERRFGSTDERLTIFAHGFARTCGCDIALIASFTLLDERGLGRSRQRFAILIDCLGVTARSCCRSRRGFGGGRRSWGRRLGARDSDREECCYSDCDNLVHIYSPGEIRPSALPH